MAPYFYAHATLVQVPWESYITASYDNLYNRKPIQTAASPATFSNQGAWDPRPFPWLPAPPEGRSPMIALRHGYTQLK